MKFNGSWVHIFESNHLYSNDFARSLRVDIEYTVKSAEVLESVGYYVDTFEIISVDDMNSGEDLTSLLNDPEIGTVLRSEINKEIEKNESYLVDKAVD